MRIKHDSMKTNSKNFVSLIRPDQYIKNIFIFLPLFFGLKITDSYLFLNATCAFIAFSLTASAVYILNDLHDVEQDQLHPTKKSRPIASGAVTQSQAIALMVGLLFLGLSLSYILPLPITKIVLAYVAMNIVYTFYLKKTPILDVTVVAVGFVIRLFVGFYATGVSLSEWIIVMTFLLALFVALAKRRDDVKIFVNTGNKTRRVVDSYSLEFLDATTATMASVVIVSYIGYTTSAPVVERYHSEYLYLTAFFVILGIMRYLQFIFVLDDAGSPTKIVLTDRFIQLIILGWGLSFLFILY